MARNEISDEAWELVAELFPKPARTGRPPSDRRMVFDGILWILRTGAPWRDLPEEFGPWQTAWRLFDQWNGDGTLDRVLHRLRSSRIDGEAEVWFVDGTIIRAARCAAGGGKKGIETSRQTTH